MPSDPAALTAFIRARIADDLAGIGNAREPYQPPGYGSPCPDESCGQPIRRTLISTHSFAGLHHRQHMIFHDHSTHTVTADQYNSIPDRRPYTAAALAVQDRCRAITAVVDALGDPAALAAYRDGLQLAVELLAGAWRSHPDYSTVIRGGSPAGDTETYVDTRTTLEQEGQ